VISAGSAGAVVAIITTPVAAVKTRIMLSAAEDGSGADAMKKVGRAQANGQSVTSLASEKGATRKSGRTVAQEAMKESGVRGLSRVGLLKAHGLC